MAFPYAPPQVIIQAQGARLLAALNSVRPCIVLLGTAPQGPDTPLLIDPASAPSMYGSPNDPATVGYTLPLLMSMVRRQAPPTGSGQAMAFLVCRCGVQRATSHLRRATPTDQVWTLRFGTIPSHGTFAMTYLDSTSDPITFDTTPSVTAGNIQTALQALATVGSGNVTVTGVDAQTYVITAASAFAGQLLPNFGVDASQMAPVGMTSIVRITTPGASTGTSLVLSGVGSYAGTAGDSLAVRVVTDSNGLVLQILVYDTLLQPTGAPVDQVWTLTLTGLPTGGTFKLGYNNETTAAITYDPTPDTTAANIASALIALSSIPSGGVTVSAINGETFTITAAGGLAQTFLPGMSVDTTSLTPLGTLTGTVLTSVLGGDTPGTGWALLQFYESSSTNLSTPQAIASAMNGANGPGQPNAVLQAAIVDALTPLPDPGYYLFGGGDDGKGTAADSLTIPTLLSQSLAYRADYVVAAWDAHELADVISTHLNDAHNQNQFRCAVLGPRQGTLYADLTSGVSPYNDFLSARVVLVGHDAVMFPNPASGHLSIYDGFYLAAAVAGLKAVSPPEETCIGFPINGIAAVAVPADANITSPLSTVQKDALALAGFLVVQPGQSGRPEIRDDLTTAPWSVNNQLNPFSQWNVQTIDDTVSETLMRAVLPYRGRPMPDVDTARTMLKQACTEAMASLGQTINGVQSITVDISADTLVPVIDVVYVTRFPFRTILIRTSYVFV